MPDLQQPTQPVSQAPPPGDPSLPTNNQTKTLVDVLLSHRLLTPAQIQELKVKSASEGKTIDQLIEGLGIVSEDKISEAKAELLGVPFISLSTTSFSPQALALISRAVAERFNLIPFNFDDKNNVLSVAMSDPVDLEALSFIQQKTGLSIKSYAATASDVRKSIAQQYRQELITEVGQAVKETEALHPTKTVDTAAINQLIKEAPIAKIVSTILEYAVTSRASDVHIEPQEDRLRVRYRIDGILYDKLSLPKTVQEALISRIKILSEMKIDEHRTPQDGRFNFKAADQEVDLRISIIPASHGEKVVMRLLRKSGGIPSLSELGLGGTSLRTLETSILKPHGIIIVCGPTGSGKTTTLYSVLSKLNTTRVNIMSLEDPVEYEIPGVNQVQINPAVGLTFADGLRAFLRQDPNIILVGEIRDQETTDLALQAALTGHLVFSTLHTSNASGALPRLLDLGAESFLLASTMNALVGQRIVRKICDHCKEAYPAPPQIIKEIKDVLGKLFTIAEQDAKLYRGKGCQYCGDTGYIGRIGIFEVLSVTEKIGHLVLQKSDTESIETEAVAEGMITMEQDGYLKVLQGITSIEEVIRVAQE